jgi:hypothetical protein
VARIKETNGTDRCQQFHGICDGLHPSGSRATSSRCSVLERVESVFSGMARAIIHNSDHQSVDDAKSAIDLHFAQRNEHFRVHPQKAGKRIWGRERQAPTFSESNNKGPEIQVSVKSASGQKRKAQSEQTFSALPRRADITQCSGMSVSCQVETHVPSAPLRGLARTPRMKEPASRGCLG